MREDTLITDIFSDTSILGKSTCGNWGSGNGVFKNYSCWSSPGKISYTARICMPETKGCFRPPEWIIWPGRMWEGLRTETLEQQHFRKWASLVAQTIKNLPAMRETRVRSLGWEDPLERGMATPSSHLAWGIPWTEEPGGPQFMGLQRVGHNWVSNASTLGPLG